MSDFADGIAPQRYVCRRPTNCHQRKQCVPGLTSIRPYENAMGGASAAHWSLDEGRWKGSSVSCDDASVTFPPPAPEPNAFIGFKRFVDSKLDILTPVRERQAQVETKRQSNEDAWTRWTGQDQHPECTTAFLASNEAREAARLMLRQAEASTLDVPSHTIRDLFREDPPDYASRPESMANAMLAFGGACYFLPEIGDRLPSSKSLFRPTPLPYRWLSMEWFQNSPYSPLHVEIDASLPGPSGMWRAAFEDLMASALERPLPRCATFPGQRTFPYEHNPAWLQPGIDWIVGLQLRGILPPILPRLLSEQPPRSSRLDSQRGKKDFDQLTNSIEKSGRAQSILRMCQSHIYSADPGSSSPHPSKNIDIQDPDARLEPSIESVRSAAEQISDPGLSHGPCNPSKSAVLIAVQTTSKTTRTMDGKVSTRTVVRRQYNDGTEEELETLHSLNDSPTPAC